MTEHPAHQRWVFDTNVVVAGLLWRGRPYELLNHVMYDESISPFTSPVLLQELARTLSYAKFSKRMIEYNLTEDRLFYIYKAMVSVITPT